MSVAKALNLMLIMLLATKWVLPGPLQQEVVEFVPLFLVVVNRWPP